jgi:hypothetical protein
VTGEAKKLTALLLAAIAGMLAGMFVMKAFGLPTGL